MKSLLRSITLGLLLVAPLSALAQTPTVSAISDVSLNAGVTRNVNVVAFSAGVPITLTASLPAFATLNGPTTGTGLVSTTITLAPAAGNEGTYNASVTATSGTSSTTENFLITVNAAGTNLAPVVNAPAVQNGTVGTMLTFTVTATDSEAITSLSAIGLPSGATFVQNGTNTSGTFSWTPTSGQTGDFDVVFTASNSGSGSATTHIHVTGTNHVPVLTAPATQTVTEGSTLAFTVTATDQDGDHVTLTTGALPDGATATDQGNNTLNFSWQPNSSQSGTYTITFNGDDGHGGTASATTTITVQDQSGSCVNAPVITAPATRTVTEGQTVAFSVTATDADADHVTLTTGSLPSGATATDQGNNSLNFSWQPNTSQSGTYTVTFFGSDGSCNQVSATTSITVLDSGGGGGNGQATITLIGQVNTHNDRTCFRIRSVNNSFDLRDVNLSSFTLQFNGQTLTPLAGRVTLQTDCEDEGGDGDDHDGDCDHDAARLNLGGNPHGHGDGEDDDDDCDECDNDCGDCNSDCDATGIKVCFSTSALMDLFGDTIQDDLTGATIHFTLANGTEIVATFDNVTLTVHGKGKGMHIMARPNPLNPTTKLSFTLSRGGRVQVSVFDPQGRLVKRILDQNLVAGPQEVVWDGSNSRNGRVASGVYFFRIQAPEGQEVQRVAVVK